MISVFISILDHYTNDRRRLNRENSSITLRCGLGRGSQLCPLPRIFFGILFLEMLHFSNHYLYPLAHWGREGGIAAVSPSKYALMQGTHCTNNNVTCLQSQQQLQLEQSCSVIVERYLEQQSFYLSPERSGYDSAVLTDAGRAFQAHAAATGNARSPSVIRRVVGTSNVDVDLERSRRCRHQTTDAVFQPCMMARCREGSGR